MSAARAPLPCPDRRGQHERDRQSCAPVARSFRSSSREAGGCMRVVWLTGWRDRRRNAFAPVLTVTSTAFCARSQRVRATFLANDDLWHGNCPSPLWCEGERGSVRDLTVVVSLQPAPVRGRRRSDGGGCRDRRRRCAGRERANEPAQRRHCAVSPPARPSTVTPARDCDAGQGGRGRLGEDRARASVAELPTSQMTGAGLGTVDRGLPGSSVVVAETRLEDEDCVGRRCHCR